MSAVGPIGKAIEALRATLADCAHFRTWQGNTWDQAQALAHIHPHGLPDPVGQEVHSLDDLAGYRPFVEIYLAEEGIELELDAAPNHYLDSGAIVARFEQAVPADDPKQSAEADFDNFIDQVIRSEDKDNPGLVELAARPGYFFFERLTIEPTIRTHAKQRAELGDAQARFLIFEFGAV